MQYRSEVRDTAALELRGERSIRLADRCVRFVLFSRLAGTDLRERVHQISMTLRRYKVLRRYSFGAPVETRKTLVSERKVGENHAQTRSTYANIGRYLAEMNIGEDIMALILSTPNDGIRWLTPDELRSTRLVHAAQPWRNRRVRRP